MLYGGKFSVSNTRSVSGLSLACAPLINNREALARTRRKRLSMSGYRNPWRTQECLGPAMVSTGLYRFWRLAHHNSAMGHVSLGFLHRVFAEVENTRRQYSTGVAFDNAVSQVLQIANAARSNHWNAQRITDRSGNAQVETVFHAVLVHAGQQDLTGAQALHFLRPLDRIEAGRLAPAVGEDLPARGFARTGYLLRVDGNHDALRT